MIPQYVSFQQTRCYQDSGSFTLTLNTIEHKDCLAIGNYILVNNEALIIENIHAYYDVGGEFKLAITGSNQGEVTKALLSRNMLVSAECGILPNTQFALSSSHISYNRKDAIVVQLHYFTLERTGFYPMTFKYPSIRSFTYPATISTMGNSF